MFALVVSWKRLASTLNDRHPYLRHQPLVLVEPRLPHGGFVIKTLSQKFKLLLANQLFAQSHAPLMLRLLQSLPCLKDVGEKNEASQEKGKLYVYL